MPPRPAPDPPSSIPHEPQAFESDLDRHRQNDDEVYGSHGVQADLPPAPARPGRLSGRRRRPLQGDR